MSIFGPADILLPRNTDFSKWSVVACDQYTSEPEYWEKAAAEAEGAPSSLNIIFPEAYLENKDSAERIKKINETMQSYIDGGIFEEYGNSMVYVERRQSDGRTRRGIVGAVDLECYDFSAGSQSPIRATEGTILSRIPPRQRVRENAPLELPHIIMLADDRERRIAESVEARKDELKLLYDFDLMLGGGHVTGRLLDEKAVNDVLTGIEALADDDEYNAKYGVSGGGKLVLAVGDGNHSLATAKTCWEELKKTLTPEQRKTHPARYALAELMNLHDDALEFEAIHRVVFGTEPEAMIEAMKEYYPQITEEDNGGQCVGVVYGDTEKTFYIKDAPSVIAAGTVQRFIDEYIGKNGGTVDYIHGGDVTRSLAAEPGRIGFILGSMGKDQLFETVIKDGALPRKTFSMGEAADKRYYLEARKIR